MQLPIVPLLVKQKNIATGKKLSFLSKKPRNIVSESVDKVISN
jgi:hypothetical protein